MGRWGNRAIGRGELKYLIYIVSVGIGIIIFGVQCELNISRKEHSRDIKLALLTFILDLNCMPSLSYLEMRLRCIGGFPINQKLM